MLERYYRFAARLRAIRPLLWGAALLSAIAFVVTLAPAYRGGSEAYALLAVTGLLWALWLITVAHSFRSAPPTLRPDAPLLTRVKLRAKWLWRWLEVVIVTLLGGFVVIVSLRALGMMLRMSGN
jgi:fatty acid desaturase